MAAGTHGAGAGVATSHRTTSPLSGERSPSSPNRERPTSGGCGTPTSSAPTVSSNAPLADYFPGVDVVDLLGLDGYIGGTEVTRMGGWLSPNEVFDATLVQLEALSDKPIVLAETASARRGGDRADWAAQLVATLRRHPQVIGFVWFEVPRKPTGGWPTTARSSTP